MSNLKSIDESQGKVDFDILIGGVVLFLIIAIFKLLGNL